MNARYEAINLATITCPACGCARRAEVPGDTRVVGYVCPRCGAISRSRAGDCGVFSSYADPTRSTFQERTAVRRRA
ncbi:MAG TPA: GDCCVxC domain-containing (seleno)protein [Anaerolinea sp.]|nr:GDCCVxC domain-containing (seleno)protein [Anaerolinea sp.]